MASQGRRFRSEATRLICVVKSVCAVSFYGSVIHVLWECHTHKHKKKAVEVTACNLCTVVMIQILELNLGYVCKFRMRPMFLERRAAWVLSV